MNKTNELKNTLLSLSQKLVSDLTSELNAELKSLPLHFDSKALDKCYEIVDKIKDRLDQLRGSNPPS